VALEGVPGLKEARRIGIDGMSPMMAALVGSVAPSAELVDATPVLERARRVKTADELACIETAVAVAEACLTHSVDRLRPGITERGLFGTFMERLGDFGLAIPAVEASFSVTPRHTGPDGATLRRIGTGRHVNEGDLVACDAGVHYAGYEGGLARTWLCRDAAMRAATPAQRSLHRRWSVLRDALLAACRPGRPAGDVLAAYRETGEKLPGVPVLHGLGLGMEPPIVGAGVPDDAGASTIIEAGMVVALQGYVHEERTGGYLGRDVVAVTGDGLRLLTRHSYGPLADERD
jgi:Xaa-Pro aminopeptidase